MTGKANARANHEGAAARRSARPALDIERSSSSLTKMLAILDLFTLDTSIWSTNDLIHTLGTSRSTGYRYIKAMQSSGLLSAVGNGYHVLGPRIIELDLQIRICDPFHKAGTGVLEQLVHFTGHSALLCMLFQSSVLCIGEHLAPLSPENMFSRGQRRSLFRGATSKVILANLPHHRLRSIFARTPTLVQDADLGANWEEFRLALARIRRDGHSMSYGEFNPGVLGVAAPVFNSEKLILGSVGVAWSQEEQPDVEMNKTILAVKRAAREISSRLKMASADADFAL